MTERPDMGAFEEDLQGSEFANLAANLGKEQQPGPASVVDELKALDQAEAARVRDDVLAKVMAAFRNTPEQVGVEELSNTFSMAVIDDRETLEQFDRLAGLEDLQITWDKDPKDHVRELGELAAPVELRSEVNVYARMGGEDGIAYWFMAGEEPWAAFITTHEGSEDEGDTRDLTVADEKLLRQVIELLELVAQKK